MAIAICVGADAGIFISVPDAKNIAVHRRDTRTQMSSKTEREIAAKVGVSLEAVAAQRRNPIFGRSLHGASDPFAPGPANGPAGSRPFLKSRPSTPFPPAPTDYVSQPSRKPYDPSDLPEGGDKPAPPHFGRKPRLSFELTERGPDPDDPLMLGRPKSVLRMPGRPRTPLSPADL